MNAILWADMIAIKAFFRKKIEDWSMDDVSDTTGGGHTEIGTASDPIVGLCAMSNQLLIFKRSSIYRLLGDRPSNYRVVLVTGDADSMANTARVSYRDVPYWMTKAGMYYHNGQSSGLTGTAQQIRDIIEKADLSRCKAAENRDRLYFTCRMGNGTMDDSIIVFDINERAYMLRNGFTVADICSLDGKLYMVNDQRYLVLLSLWGMVTRALMGRDQTWNPYGMAKDLAEDFQEGGMKQVAAGIGETLTENVPFVSMLTEGGRVPLAGNITNVTDIIQAIWNDETLSNADWIKGATSFVPGGGQLRKIITGIEANAKGGYYTDKGNLRYPIEQKDYLKSALFGPSAAAPRGYEWGDTLSAKETEAYETLTDQGLDGSDLYDTLVNMNTVTGSKSEKALSLLANRNDFDDEEVNMIAAALGIEYKGSLESYAEKSAEKYLKDKRKDLKDGEITQEKYDEIESVFDEYFRLLGMAN